MVEQQIRARGIIEPHVLAALEQIPRHRFVPPSLRYEAYADHPLPIGSGQTISQPYIVAVMTEALSLTPTDKVLEIGTGSGYQTALLATLANKVFTIERSRALLQTAQKRLEHLGYENIVFIIGDGTFGLPEEAPFDKILATGSLPEPPAELLRQLAPNGIFVGPVGGRLLQQLVRVERRGSSYRTQKLGACCFVPLIGKAGWSAHDPFP